MRGCTDIRSQLKLDEGKRLYVYIDSEGFQTVGIGHKVRPEDGLKIGDHITEEQCDQFFDEDVAIAVAGLDANLPWWKYLDEARGAVLVNMAFQVGIRGLTKFRDFLDAMETSNWPKAAYELIDSKAMVQTPARMARRVLQVATGVWV